MNLDDWNAGAGAPETKPWLRPVAYSIECVDAKFDDLAIAGVDIRSSVARADTSAGLWGPGVRSTWSIAAGVGLLDGIIGVHIDSGPEIGRSILSSGAGQLSGPYYTDDGGATFTACAGCPLTYGALAYNGATVLFIAPATGDVYSSADYGTSFTLLASGTALGLASGISPIIWSQARGLYVARASGAATIATSPTGAVWTFRASATRSNRELVETKTGFVTVGSSGVMTSPDAITWTLGVATPMLSGAYSPELDQVLGCDQTNGSIVYTSTDSGATWVTHTGMKTETEAYRVARWIPELGSYILPQCGGGPAGENFIYRWGGDPRIPFIGGQPMGLLGGTGNGSGGTAIYGLSFNPTWGSMFVGYNAASQLWVCRTVDAAGVPGQNLGCAGSVLATSAYLRPTAAAVALGPAGSSSQLWQNSAAADALTYTVSGVSYPLAGSSIERTKRFDASLSATLYDDGSVLVNWDGVNRQPRIQIAATPWFTSTGFDASAYYSFSVAAPSTNTAEGLAFLAATNYYLSSAATARSSAFDGNKPSPMVLTYSLWPTTGTGSSVPYYEIQLRLSPTALAVGHYSVRKLYSF